jgi:uncharacterized protein YbjT (DUF2867 family)
MEPSSSRILVVGASGKVGQPVVHGLLKRGFSVRVAARNEEKLRSIFGSETDAVALDVTDPASVAAAVDGCDGVHISLHGPSGEKKFMQVEREGVRNVLCAAEKAGVRALTYVSGATIGDEDENLYIFRGKREAENILLEGSVPVTLLRPSWFMDTLDMMVRKGKAYVIGRIPSLIHPIAGSDFGGMVATCYEKEIGSGIYYAYGPQAMTFTEAMEIILAHRFPDGKLVRIPLGILKVLKTIGFGQLGYLHDLMNHFRVFPEPNHHGPAEEVFGRNSTSLKHWLIDKYGHAVGEPDSREGVPETEGPAGGEEDEEVYDLPLRGGRP